MNILICDDDHMIIRLITDLCAKILNQPTMTVVQEKNQAIQLIQQEIFNLAIIQFGQISHLTNEDSIRTEAFEIARTIKKYTPETKIIVNSSYGFTRDDFLNLGVDCFINSPFDREQLVEAILQLT